MDLTGAEDVAGEEEVDESRRHVEENSAIEGKSLNAYAAKSAGANEKLGLDSDAG